MFSSTETNRENDKGKALELLQTYMKQYLNAATTATKNTFYEKARAYIALYAAQLSLQKGDFDAVTELLSQTFSISSKLCNNENFVVFCLSVLKKLMKVSPKATDAMIKCVENIAKELNPKQEKAASILLYLADTAMGLGTKGYTASNRIYEALMNTVLHFSVLKI